MRLPKLLLDRLEDLEQPLLAWGYVEGSFTEAELFEAAEAVAREHHLDEDPNVAVRTLIDTAMLLILPNTPGRYRTRMAETVRLAARLRQVMPHQPWPTAPSLVADYRFDFKTRQRPSFVVPRDTLIERLHSQRTLSQRERAALNCLLGSEFQHLARFQAEATVRIRERIGRRTSANIVCAGTGAGKTVAFYLPCLTAIADRLTAETWTQALVVYPRKVLLADQFTKAYSQARKLDAMLNRKIRIGAFFGDVPNSSDAKALEKAGWKQGARWICPFLQCPKCNSPMQWRKPDQENNVERLCCTKSDCGQIVGPDEVAITKRSVRELRPDLLFTTTEMLHKEISSHQNRHVFGIGCSKRPYLMLLDEAHTYYGTHGAQVALVLRRWRHAMGGPVQFVGLSATLGDPAGFFAELVGVAPQWVNPVSVEEEMVPIGREYRLVLRANPVSGTSVLSTSIQTSMLMSRMLDPLAGGCSHGLQPPKLFVFTDDLDVTNRLFHDLLDAEGQNWRGDPVKDPLAALRAPRDPLQDEAGQSWWAAIEVGNHLDRQHPIGIGRTSSKDPGLENQKKIVVATSSLEVGYDDDAVGGVVQHKAPRGAASFLQRKGRGGRKLRARPWTVMVLSDYGRDRFAYQTWEHVFEPMLTRPPLPTKNRYVLKMQATAALIDWLGEEVGSHCKNVWMDISGVSEGRWEQSSLTCHRYLADLLRRVLDDAVVRQRLSHYLTKALDLRADEVMAVMWESPRALMTAVIPTLLRRLESGWGLLGRTGFNLEGHRARKPLFEFLSDNLFSDLNVPELLVEYEENAGQFRSEVFRIAQGMRESAPGRVTRRFSLNAMRGSHWVQPPVAGGQPWDDRPMPFNQYCLDYEEIGTVCLDGREMRLVMPRTVRETYPPGEVKASTNACHEWHTQIVPFAPGTPGDEARGAPLTRLIRSVRFHHIANGNPVQICRYSTGAEVSYRARPTVEHEFRVPFVDEEGREPVAIGFTQEVDAVCFECEIDLELVEQAKKGPSEPTLRATLFRKLVAQRLTALRTEAPEIRGMLNAFDYDWLANVFMAAIALRASAVGTDAINAFALEEDWTPWLRPVMLALFQIDDTHLANDEDPPGLDDLSGPRRFSRVRDLFADARVRATLVTEASVLTGPLGLDVDPFVREQIRAALAGCLLLACVQSIPDCDPEDLSLDLEGENRIWVSEQVIGGAGLIERLQRAFAADPRAFNLKAEIAALPGDLENAHAGLTEVVRSVAQESPEPHLAGALELVRGATNRADLKHYQNQLRDLLNERHFGAGHTFMVALNARILRPGTDPQYDCVLNRMLTRWDGLETELGFEIDVRVFATIAANEREENGLWDLLQSFGYLEPTAQVAWGAAYSMLWVRGSEVRKSGLTTYNPYALPLGADPIYLRTLLRWEGVVDVADERWRADAETLLREKGTVRLEARQGAEKLLAAAIRELLNTSVDTGFLSIYPSVVHAQASFERQWVTLHIKENV